MSQHISLKVVNGANVARVFERTLAESKRRWTYQIMGKILRLKRPPGADRVYQIKEWIGFEAVRATRIE